MKDISSTAGSSSVIVAIQPFVQKTTTEFHATHRIADKRMQTGIESLFITEVLAENHIFGGQYSLAAYIIRVHTFPSARDGATVEDYHQTVVVSITQNIFIQAHRFLLVATKEINFDSFHSKALQPFHFTFADNSIVHVIHRSLLNIIPIAGRAIP